MARIARIVVPGIPLHITQRGNRRQQTFFCDGDYRLYVTLMRRWCDQYEVAIWAYCLMPNHVHLIACPTDEAGLSKAIGEAHRRYTRKINFREGWRGYLWQGRFASFPMDESYLLAAARYVELNPVRAGMVSHAGGFPWSSARAHLRGRDDALVQVRPLLEMVNDWETLLRVRKGECHEVLRRHQRTGRPLGSDNFIRTLSERTGRDLGTHKPGPKSKSN